MNKRGVPNVFKQKLSVSLLAILVMSSVLFLVPHVAKAASVFTVNTENDGADNTPGDNICETSTPGECTLRAAIEEANANGNPGQVDTIAFSIPGAGIHTLTPTGALDTIDEPLAIDGSTQGAIDCTNHELLIELNGVNFPTGSRNLFFVAGSEGSSVHGIATTGAQADGMGVAGAGLKIAADDMTVTCNNIGVKADGTTAGSNSLGVVVVASNLQLGGPATTDGNLISNMLQYGTHIGHDVSLHVDRPANIVIQNNSYHANTINSISVANSDDLQILNNTVTNNPQVGVHIQESNRVLVQGNNLSNNDTGLSVIDSTDIEALDNTTSSNDVDGIHVQDVVGLTVQDNTTSTNGDNGVHIEGVGNYTVQNNLITNNTGDGISLDTNTNATIVGNRATGNNDGLSATNIEDGEIRGNVFGENYQGIAFSGTITAIQVAGNYIGIDDDGVAPLANSLAGVAASGTFVSTVVGGTTAADRNIITYNAAVGILLLDADGLVVSGNYIGVDESGEINQANAASNTQSGIAAMGSTNITIGGTAAGAANIISGNNGGVNVVSIPAAEYLSQDVSVLGNSIYRNDGGASGIGIDLQNDSNGDFAADENIGPTANDAGDLDDGPNYYMNFPVISNVQAVGDVVTVTYSLDINPAEDAATGYRVEFFAGDGKTFIGSETISGDVTNHSVTFTNTGLAAGDYLVSGTTTAINASPSGFGSTSEFGNTSSVTITGTLGILPEVGKLPGLLALALGTLLALGIGFKTSREH